MPDETSHLTRTDASGSMEAMRWALDLGIEPSLAAANWLAQDIDSQVPTAEALLTNPAVPLDHLHAAKSAFKTMRISGETAADRRMGASLYAAAIAAGLVHHGERISTQSDGALERAFNNLRDNVELPGGVRQLGIRGLELLHR